MRKRSVEPSHHHQGRLSGDDRVQWSKQQRIKSRKKRDFLSFHEPKIPSYPTMMMGKNRMQTTDPKWPQMWYLVSEFQISFRTYIPFFFCMFPNVWHIKQLTWMRKAPCGICSFFSAFLVFSTYRFEKFIECVLRVIITKRVQTYVCKVQTKCNRAIPMSGSHYINISVVVSLPIRINIGVPCRI